MNDKIDQIAKCQLAFFGITVNFIIQKLKSKYVLSLDQFSLGFFEGTREDIPGHRHLTRTFNKDSILSSYLNEID